MILDPKSDVLTPAIAFLLSLNWPNDERPKEKELWRILNSLLHNKFVRSIVSIEIKVLDAIMFGPNKRDSRVVYHALAKEVSPTEMLSMRNFLVLRVLDLYLIEESKGPAFFEGLKLLNTSPIGLEDLNSILSDGSRFKMMVSQT